MKAQKPLVIGAAIALAAAMIGLTATGTSQSITIGNQASLIQTLSENSDALRDQVKDSGETPIAPQAKVVVGEAGKAGEAGSQGPRGLDGAPGPQGDMGLPGQTGPPGLNGAPGAPGSPGSDGSNGAPGPPGPAGADSTVPGPAGPPGADGAAGAPGQPPAGWTYTDRLGMNYQCTRTEPFDPAAPTYVCAPKETP